MSENTEVTAEQVVALLKTRYQDADVVFKGAICVEDVFNEVSKADPPDYAWYVLATVKMPEDSEPQEMSFQIGEKDGVLKIYCTWDYSIFDSDEEQAS